MGIAPSTTPALGAVKAKPKRQAKIQAESNAPGGGTQQVPPATKETTQQAHAELASGTVEDGQAESLETLQNAQTGEPSRGSNEEAVPEASAAAARKVRIAPSTTPALGAVKAKPKRQA